MQASQTFTTEQITAARQFLIFKSSTQLFLTMYLSAFFRNRSDDKGPSQVDTFDSFQKKIVPWQSMLGTDIDLSRQQTTAKRRFDLIIMASLIDK